MEVGVIFYSMTGNVLELAEAVSAGVEEVRGAKAQLRVVPELIPKEKVFENSRMREVYERKQNIEEANPEDLREFDGFVFGSPTRYGNVAAQLREFFDRTGNIWQEGSTIGKFAGIFTSTATVHGGQETTPMSLWPTFMHLGMLPVGIPYSEQLLFDLEPGGGSPYAASSVSGPNGDRGPTDRELQIARGLGRRVAELTRAQSLGCHLLHLERTGRIEHAEAFLLEGDRTRGD